MYESRAEECGEGVQRMNPCKYFCTALLGSLVNWLSTVGSLHVHSPTLSLSASDLMGDESRQKFEWGPKPKTVSPSAIKKNGLVEYVMSSFRQWMQWVDS